MKRVQAQTSGVQAQAGGVKAVRARRTACAVPAHISFVQSCGGGHTGCSDATLAAWLAGQAAGLARLPLPAMCALAAPPPVDAPADDALSSSDTPFADVRPSERDQEADSGVPRRAAPAAVALAPVPAPRPADSSPTASSMDPPPGSACAGADAEGPARKRARRVSFDDGAPQVFYASAAPAPAPAATSGGAAAPLLPPLLPPFGVPEDLDHANLVLISQLLGPENAPSVARLKRRLELLSPGLHAPSALAAPIPAP